MLVPVNLFRWTYSRNISGVPDIIVLPVLLASQCPFFQGISCYRGAFLGGRWEQQIVRRLN